MPIDEQFIMLRRMWDTAVSNLHQVTAAEDCIVCDGRVITDDAFLCALCCVSAHRQCCAELTDELMRGHMDAMPVAAIPDEFQIDAHLCSICLRVFLLVQVAPVYARGMCFRRVVHVFGLVVCCLSQKICQRVARHIASKM